MSPQLDLSGCKKRKRGERVFKFKAFGERGYPVEFNGSFEQNVRALSEVGQLEIGLCDPLMPCWSFQLEVHRHPLVHVFLLVVEEPIELSLNHCCKHCQYIGWGDHLICNKKYHFLLPSKETISACISYEGNTINATTARSIASKSKNLIELQGHTMHGVFHSNGFGHLLCINVAETGSDLAGYHIMEFWDRLCTGLRAREVSLRDISQKQGMDLRLLYAIAYGKSWFGQWGYKFGRGSFAITQSMYQNAIEALQNIPLGLFAQHLGNEKNNDILTILSRYQMLSGHILVTLGDTFHFMLDLKTKLPRDQSNSDSPHQGMLVDTSCRWSPKRVEMAIRVIIESLKRAEFRWISRQEVRDAARAYIGDTGLLDFVLKSLGNHIVGKYLVRRCLNPVTKVLEYCLEDISHAFPNKQVDGYGRVKNYDSKLMKPQYKITWAQLMKDLVGLYKLILQENKAMSSIGVIAYVPIASRIILDTKYFTKEYYSEKSVPFLDKSLILIQCSIALTSNNIDGGNYNSFRKVMVTPYEFFLLRNNATFDELKLEVECKFRDLYWGLRNFVVESVANLDDAKGSDLVFELIKESSNKLVFKGNIISGESFDISGISEGYESNLVVDCSCGTKSDDGERMVSCDICEVWQHTRCVHIPNNEEIPTIFLCNSCEQDILRFPSLA